MDMGLIEQIEKCRFFSTLPRQKIIELLYKFEKHTLNAGDVLFSQGDPSDSIYILLSGKLVSVLTKYSGETQIIGTINPIETVGELGVLSGELRSLTVEAVSDNTEVLKLPGETFKQLCHDHVEIMADISKLIVERSLKTIKLMVHEKPSYKVNLILPYVDASIPITELKEKFRSYLNQYANVDFISSDETNLSEIKNQLVDIAHTKRPLFIFLTDWQQDILDICIGKLEKFYLILDASKPAPPIGSIKNYVKHFSKIRLDLILLHQPNAKIENTRNFLKLAKFNLHHHVRINNEDDYQRVLRFMTGNAYTLVMGGGGAKGLSHLGVIKALIEKNIPIDAIGGTSIGAGVGAFYASTMNYEKMKTGLDALKDQGHRSISFRNITWPLISLFSSNPATQGVQELFGEQYIEDLIIPYFAISSNLSEKKEEIQTSGLLWQALRASMSIPGIYPPLVINGQLLVDGGILNNLPVDIMRGLIGPDHTIIASSLARNDSKNTYYNFPPLLTLTQTLLFRLGIGYKDNVYPPFLETFRDALLLGSASNEQRNELMADILIKPDLSTFKILSVAKKKEEELIGLGYAEAIKQLNLFLANKNKS